MGPPPHHVVRRRVRFGRLSRAVLLAAVLLACALGGVRLARDIHAALPGPPGQSTEGAVNGPATAWRATRGPSLPQPLEDAAAAYAAGADWVAGGEEGGTWPTADIWRLGGRSLTAAGLLAAPTYGAALVVVKGGMLLIGGTSSGDGGATELLVPRGSRVRARTLASLPGALASPAAVADAGGAVLAGGSSQGTPSADLVRVSPNGAARVAGSLPAGLRYAAAARLGDTMWLFGGETAAGPTGAVWRIDLRAATAKVCGHLPVPVTRAMAWTWGGFVYVAGGQDKGGVPRDRVLRWRPSACDAVSSGRLPEGLAGAAVAHGPDGVWLIGGQTAAGATDRTWRLLPVAASTDAKA